MKLKTLLCVIGTLLSILSTEAQEMRPLQIGDTVPDLLLHNVVNYRDATVKISDFKDKLLILDFWATWCTSCIEHFSFMDSMEVKYHDKIAIFGIGYEPYEKIRQFFYTKKGIDGKPYKLPSTTGDSLLTAYFPHRTVPHVVWIKQNGTIGAITSGNDLTESNILHMVQGETLQVRTKKDVDVRRPLHLATDFAYSDSLLGYSILYKAHDPGPSMVNMTRKIGRRAIGKVLTNHSLLDMYRLLAYPIFLSKGQKLGSRQIFVSMPDSEAGKLKELYCFDIVVPSEQENSLNRYAITELNRLTGFKTSITKYRARCLVLKAKPNAKLYASSGKDRISRLWFDGMETYMRGYPLQMLTDRLNELPTVTIPVVDDTGTKDKVDIILSGSNELVDIRRDLSKYGLSLVEEERVIDALVITKDKGNP
ncbi:MAG: hypothetical protein DI598_06960 [Pseudopedobacter saltans]|uniref:Thioredoxin domain-containing protein n=1 Tax=Pseudopedobacter saltans TaxID=151895 RepID=A0A2W5F848_9SPHI|nr:MAG: hypothetical protein DI598_06960 [Pseudopedobacter saltans]